MPIKGDEHQGICIVAVMGELAGDNVAAARRVVEAHLDQRRGVDVIFDLEKTPFIDSAGLETLLWTKRRCEDVLGQVKLAGPDETVRKVLQLTRLEHRFECHADLAGALK